MWVRTERPGLIVVLAQNAGGHVSRTQPDGRELKAAARELLQSDAGGGDVLNGAGDLLDRGGKAASIRIPESLVCLTRFRIFSYSIRSSVFSCDSAPTFWRKVLYSRE